MLKHNEALDLMRKLIHFTVRDSKPKVGYIQTVLMDMQGKNKLK
ncbi:hypothetical protein C6W84_17025 (plasmid) [Acinetobacter baumannii]|nr:hypothetical protein C6W84_17025 [Acinetobacter baumannii]